MQNPHARFIATAALVLGVLAIVPALNTILLWRARELTPLDKVVRQLHEQHAIYGTAIHGVRREITLEIAKYRQPEIISLGSSRAMDMRQEFFTRRFSCACGAMDSIDDGEVFFAELLKQTRPRLALFALDFWWFTTQKPQLSGPLNLSDPIRLTREKIMRPKKWITSGEMPFSQYFKLLAGAQDLLGVTRYPKIGVMARQQSNGLREDGSQLNGIQLSPAALDFYSVPRAAIKNPAEYVSAAQYQKYGLDFRYGPDKRLVPERLKAFARAIRLLQDAGIHVIAYFPPLAPPIYDAMVADGRHQYLKDLARYFLASGLEFYDFHNPGSIGTRLCEFSDTHHSGNTAFMRILREMLRRNPHSPLSLYVDSKHLADEIKRFSGRTIAAFQAENYLAKETDFLEAGCMR